MNIETDSTDDVYEEALETTEETEKKPGFFRFLLDLLETLALAAVLYLGINAVSARIRVDGSSMEPTLRTGEYVIVNKLAYKLGSPRIGDVVVFRYPRNPSQEYIKRIIGLPGDQVKITRGRVYVNGEMLDEPYLAYPPSYQGNWSVSDSQLFVLGDNRNNSSDSHNWGMVPMENVIGKAVLIYWPPANWGKINEKPHKVRAAYPYP